MQTGQPGIAPPNPRVLTLWRKEDYRKSFGMLETILPKIAPIRLPEALGPVSAEESALLGKLNFARVCPAMWR